jgi:hypothetical protein
VHEIGGGLYYFNARWYDSSTGRFTSEDPVRDGVNWFVYVSNNPLRFVDPTGLRDVEEAGDVASSNDVPFEYGYELNEYTIDYRRFLDEDFEITYYDDYAGGPITVAYDDLELVLGEDLDFGSEVPFDAVFTVPEGSVLEIAKDDVVFALDGTGATSLPDSLERYNQVVSTEAYERAVRRGLVRERVIGTAQVLGGVAFAVGSFSAAVPAMAAAQLEPTPVAEMAIAGGAIEGMRAGLIFAATGAERLMGSNDRTVMRDALLAVTPLVYSVAEAVAQDSHLND